MTIRHLWKVLLSAGFCAAVAPAHVDAAAYTMSIQSVPAAGGKCVSAPKGQFAEGMHVLIWDCNAILTQNLAYDDQTQELKFGPNCIEVLGQGKAEDPVGIGKCSGAVTQRWSMVANGDNYQVVGVNNLCLNITNGVIANGTPLDLQPCAPNKAVELWALYQAGDASSAAQAASPGGDNQSGASDQSSNPAGNNAPGQTASASNPSSPGSDTSPGGGSGPGGSGSGPGGGSSPDGGGSGPGGGSSPGGGAGPGSTLPGVIPILIGMLTPPPGLDQPSNQPPYPPMDPANPNANTTPASGASPLPANLCGLTSDGQLVQVNMSMPPPDPNQPTDTGQYCVSGGPRNGQCGTATLNTASRTTQFCGNGVCTPPMPPMPPAGYTQTLFGFPDSSPVVPCPVSTTASNDPMGGLGPPMMDEKTGQPVYRPRPGGMPSASVPPQIITVAIPTPQTPAGGGTPGTTHSDPKCKNTCHDCKPQSGAAPPKSTSPIHLKNKLASADAKTPMMLKQGDGALKLKPSPGGTQMASTNPNMDSVPACEAKPPYLPWGGHGSASITVSGGKACGIGWHDTGATILDSMSVTSHPSHGSLTPKDQHVIIFTPKPGYKGHDSFMLSMKEHNGGRKATLTVNVSVTIN